LHKACFLDRDGVLIKDANYLSSVSDVHIYKSSFKALKLLKENGFKIIVITNQGGAAKGYFNEKLVNAVHKEINRKLELHGLKIDAFYYCLHNPDGVIPELTKECDCRKPSPGMILKAAKDFNIDLKSSFLIGDKMSDIDAALNAGCHAVLVKTGHGFEHVSAAIKRGIPVKANIYSAVKYYVSTNYPNGQCSRAHP
jgi:D,D-heptose 1,7-bisphosphate phosphatase